MEELLGKFVMSYLLMPLIAVLLGSVMFFIAKKNQLLRNRKLIGYCIIMVILLVAPATAALVKYSFMPYFYMLSLLFYFLLGTIHLKTMMHFIPESQKWLEGGEDNSYTYELTHFFLSLSFAEHITVFWIFHWKSTRFGIIQKIGRFMDTTR